MKLKNKIALVVLVCMVIGVALMALSQKETQKEVAKEKEQNESQSIQTVLDSLWDDYKLCSVETKQYDADHPRTSITVFDEQDIDPIQQYIEKQLPEKDLKHHEIDVIELSEKQDFDQPYSAKKVVDALWDNFGVHSTHFVKNDDNDEKDPEIFITVYVKKDINKIENYLEDHLSEKELEDYEIDVSYWGNRRGSP